MNERIEKLVDITADLIPGVYNCEYESGNKGVEFTEQALEKFAELIVRECCSIADEVERADTGMFASKYIKAHFGVE